MNISTTALSAFFLTSFAVPAAMAGNLPQLVVSYDVSGMPLTITHDGNGVYTFEGLPYPGQVLYTPANGVVYYQHPEDPVWHTVTPAMMSSFMVPAAVSAGPNAPTWQNQSVSRWNITAITPSSEGQTPHTACPVAFGSQGAGAMAGLNITDLHQVLTTLQWLGGGTIPNPCEKLQFSAENATKIGLPTFFTGPNGAWQLQEIVQTSTTVITLPNAYPMDDTTRLSMLLVQFSPEERAQLLQKFGNLPVLQQIQAISALLTQETL